MLDRGSGVLRSYQSPAKLLADHSGVAQCHKCLVDGRCVALGRRRELRELRACSNEVGYEVLDSAERSLNGLDAVVCVDVVGRVERPLELLQIEVAERCHRVLESCILSWELLEVAGYRLPPPMSVRFPGVGGTWALA